MQVVVVARREHALAWRLPAARSRRNSMPRGIGIAALGHCHPVRADDGDGLLALAVTLDADLVVIGPEGPLVAGVADELRRNGIAVFGPGAEAARIEGSKTFAKDVMRAAGVPTAETLAVARPPCVVKADGLAAGKGVFVCRTAEELDEALRAVQQYEGRVVIEELLEAARCRSSRSRTGAAPCRSEPRRTSSASATATPARTPAVWVRTRRSRGSTTPTT